MIGPSWIDLLVLFFKEGTLPDKKGEVDKVRGKLLISSCLRSKNCTSVPSLDHTCSVSILRQWSHCWKSYMREYVEVI